MGKSCTVLSIYVSTRHVRICPMRDIMHPGFCVETKKQFVKHLRQILQVLTQAKLLLTPTGDVPV